MSYVRSFNKTITVSGTVAVSYPASEHGGVTTASYSESVPIGINIHVDTQNFDQSVMGTNHSIDALTGALAAMDAAQCATIAETSEQISNRIVDGFFSLIKSDLSVQKSENRGLLQSRFALLLELSKDVADKHTRMESDVARLKRHFSTLFSDMDEDLKKRIAELDRDVFFLAENVHSELIDQRLKDDVTLAIGQLEDTSRSNAFLTTAHIKKKISDVFGTILQTLVNSQKYKEITSQIIESKSSDGIETQYVPLVFSIKRSVGTDTGREAQTMAPNIPAKEKMVDAVQRFMLNTTEEQWRQYSNKETEILDQSILALLEKNRAQSEGTNDYGARVQREIMKLWSRDRARIRHI